MKRSRRLLDEVCRGERPERTPIFDLYRNDAVIEHFAGAPLDGRDDLARATRAAANGLDGTRCIAGPGQPGRTWTDDLGNTWVAAPSRLSSAAAWRANVLMPCFWPGSSDGNVAAW